MIADSTEPPRGRASRQHVAPRIFYNHNGIAVTDRNFIDAGVTFDLARLSNIVKERGGRHPGVNVSLVIAVVEAALAGPFAGLSRSAVPLAITALAILIPCLVAGYCCKRWPPAFQLHADYRGEPTVLFRTADEREFGQVSRALVRALDALDNRLI